MKAAYIPVGATGHILTSLPMVGELAKKGVEVSYYAPEIYRNQVEKTGAKFLEMPIVAAAGGRAEGGEDFIAGIPLVFLAEATGVLDAVLAGLEADRPDVIITDALALAGRLAGWKLNIPVVMMFTSYAPSKAFQVSGGWPKYTDEHPARAKAKEMALAYITTSFDHLMGMAAGTVSADKLIINGQLKITGNLSKGVEMRRLLGRVCE